MRAQQVNAIARTVDLPHGKRVSVVGCKRRARQKQQSQPDFVAACHQELTIFFFEPDQFVFDIAIGMQCDLTIRWRIVIEREVIARYRKLAAGGRRANDFYRVVLCLEFLMHVTTNGCSNIA